MGVCGSQLTDEEKAQKKKSKALERRINNRQKREDQVHKLLLLGAGESGKSTLFKQVLNLFDKDYFDDKKRLESRDLIYNNIVKTMSELLLQTDNFTQLESKEAQESRAWFDENYPEEEIIYMPEIQFDSNLVGHIRTLWQDPGFVATYAQKSKYNLMLNDSLDYFIGRLDALALDDYMPTNQDILHCRVKTTGIIEKQFKIMESNFLMVDVGGQRNERKKWMHSFADVRALIFVAAISEYDQMLIEDEKMNRIYESLNLFEQIVNSPWFLKTSIILFLNKSDLFKIKINRVPLTVAFPDYDGDTADFDETSDFIACEYKARVRDDEKPLFIHVTCATDGTMMKNVFQDVKETVIIQVMREVDILG